MPSAARWIWHAKFKVNSMSYQVTKDHDNARYCTGIVGIGIVQDMCGTCFMGYLCICIDITNHSISMA